MAGSGPRIVSVASGAALSQMPTALYSAVLLCTGLATDQLYGMDRRLLDPRRPLRQAAPPPHPATDASQREAGRRPAREGLPAAALARLTVCTNAVTADRPRRARHAHGADARARACMHP